MAAILMKVSSIGLFWPTISVGSSEERGKIDGRGPFNADAIKPLVFQISLALS